MNRKLPEKTIQTIPVEEWEKIVEESRGANKLLNGSEFLFFREYLKNAKDSIILLIATNSVKDVLDTVDMGNGNTKTIKTTKEEQMNEIAGCIKFIDRLNSDLLELSQQEEKYLQLADEKKVSIGITKEDDQ